MKEYSYKNIIKIRMKLLWWSEFHGKGSLMRREGRKGMDDKCVVTKTETIGLLGIRHTEINLFEWVARIPRASKRKGYTFQEYKRLLKKVDEFYGLSPKRKLF